MPKVKKFLTATLYTYVKPVNESFIERARKQKKASKSLFVDSVLDYVRKNGIDIPVKKPMTVAEKRAQKRAEKADVA